MDYIQGENRLQITMFPESIDDYISQNNPVRIIDVYAEKLEIKVLGFTKADIPSCGRPPYNPRDILKLYLYGYLNRVRSSRRLEHEAARNIEVIWLLKKLKPDFKTIADFRKNNKKALKKVFRDFNKMCDEWNLFGKELVAIDGSKFRASNSKRNNYNAKKIDRHLKYIDEKIEKYMQELEQGDKAEADDRTPDVKEVQKRIEELKHRKYEYEDLQKPLQENGENEISTTDPDARLMTSNNNGVEMSYNVQTAVDSKHKLIADFEVTQNPNDLGELDDMALRAKELFGVEELEVLADKGYYKAEDLKKCVENGITPYVAKQTYSNGTGDKDFYGNKFSYNKEKKVYICPAGKELHYYRIRKHKDKIVGYEYRNHAECKNCKFKERCTKSQKGRSICRHVDQDFLDTIDLQTEQNKNKYLMRQMIVEHPFGTVKRGMDSYYFLTRGKHSVTAEMSLSYLAYNLKRVINILGVEEILGRLEKMGTPASA